MSSSTTVATTARNHSDRADEARANELEPEGYLILPFEAEDIYVTPEATLTKIRRHLILRGWDDVPPLNDRWRQDFAA